MQNKDLISNKIIANLDMCNVRKTQEYIEVVLPIVLFFNQQLLTLRVYPVDDGYYIATDGITFDEYSEYSENYCQHYYNLFVKNDSHAHYDIKQEGAYLYKKYDSDRSARTAIDEFVKFFIYLDEYMLNYGD